MGKNIALIGATGTIGNAFLKEYLKDDSIVCVDAFSRSTLPTYHSKLTPYTMDITCETSIEDAVSQIPKDRIYHILIVATGALHIGDMGPEKSLKQLSAEKFHAQFSLNIIGPALVSKHLFPRLERKSPCVVAFLSARVGSMSDNHLGGWYSYRCAKAALNMFIKSASIEMKRTHPHTTVLGLHPGTVDSPLTKPFQPVKTLFTPEESVRQLMHVINTATPAMSGECYDYAGCKIQP
jgi:NAD(P)-dependent dehydrogenase (short-subunit alcohol dehydrogenase family)